MRFSGLRKRLQDTWLRFNYRQFAHAIAQSSKFVLASILLNLANLCAKAMSPLHTIFVRPLLTADLNDGDSLVRWSQVFLYVQGDLPVIAQRSPPQGTGPLDPQGIESPHPQSTAHEDPLGTRTLDLQAREHPHINLGSGQSHAQATGNAQSQSMGIPNLQGTTAPQAHGTQSLDPRTTRHPSLATRHTEASCLFKDAITRDLMCDPVKCNDGRTYDRWTVIDRGITRSEPFARRPTLSIVFEDLSVRDVLFRAFPEQKDKFLSKRMAYGTKALQLPPLHPAGVAMEVAIEMLYNVLQWAPEDTICRDEHNEAHVVQTCGLFEPSQHAPKS